MIHNYAVLASFYGSSRLMHPETEQPPLLPHNTHPRGAPSASPRRHSPGSSLVEALLAAEPQRRATAEEALRHPWFRGAPHADAAATPAGPDNSKGGAAQRRSRKAKPRAPPEGGARAFFAAPGGGNVLPRSLSKPCRREEQSRAAWWGVLQRRGGKGAVQLAAGAGVAAPPDKGHKRQQQRMLAPVVATRTLLNGVCCGN